jgi:hypothetical protein
VRGDVELSPNPYSMIFSGEQEGDFIYWEKPLVQFKGITRIMVRESYEKIYELILANLRINFKDHLVTGVPGIGKSNFCLYFLWRYIKENPGSPILYESESDHIYSFSPSNSFMTNRMGCTNLQYPYLVDFREECEPSPNIGSFTVVFSSPDPKRYKQMMKDSGRASRYVMPVWTLEELVQLNQIHHIPIEEITQRFDLIGGVPRQIFSGKLKDIQTEVTNSLSMKGGEIAEHFFEQGFGMRDETISYSLIHLHPDQEDGYCTRSNSYEFASPDIWKRLYDLHHRVILMQSQNYFNGGTGAYGGSFAGYHFENICLHALPFAQTVQRIVSVNDSTIQPRELSIPTAQHVNFKIQIEPLPNVLYVPTKKNFESGDAFYFNEGELFVFQITVGASHPVKAHGLDNICALFHRNHPAIQNCHLIFVVPAEGQLNSKQNITTLKGEMGSRKSNEVKLFEKNQWRLEYHLAIP